MLYIKCAKQYKNHYKYYNLLNKKEFFYNE